MCSASRVIRYLCLPASLLLVMMNISCSRFSYYGQAVRGQLEIVTRMHRIDQLIAQETVDQETEARLQMILDIREYASKELLLPDNDSYKTYAELGREYVVWNVIAAPEFSMQPQVWCFPIVGCLPYRGYFSREAALEYAKELELQGNDVYVGGVSAYSTLGWFDDPVLDTMLRHGMTWAVRIIFHELAHQKIYIRDDTELNEAFADTVATIGVRKWLQATRQKVEYEQFNAQLIREKQFHTLISEFRDRYRTLYAEDRPVAQKRLAKTALFQDLRRAYSSLQATWGGHDEYRSWFNDGPNNARMATIITYKELEPGLSALYQATGENLQEFYRIVRSLARCEPEERRKVLNQVETGTPCG